MRQSIKIPVFRPPGQTGELTVDPALKKKKNDKNNSILPLRSLKTGFDLV